MAKLTGWKKTAVYLTILVGSLTALLVAGLFVSLIVLHREDSSELGGRKNKSLLGQSIIYHGQCSTTSSANLWIHLAINLISTGILASSNFFMQTLVAPTRAEVDKAHAASRWMEIGVQSIRNLRFLAGRRIFLWTLFSLSSVPLHLIFNGVVLESKGSNAFNFVMATESFVKGAWGGLAPYGNEIPEQTYGSYDETTVKSINESLSLSNSSDVWERLTFKDCMARYNNPKAALTHYRHVVLVISSANGNNTQGWTQAELFKSSNDSLSEEMLNPLWWTDTYYRTGRDEDLTDWYRDFISDTRGSDNGFLNSYQYLDVDTGIITNDENIFRTEYQQMQAEYCLSEKYQAPCQLSVANILLLVVCIMCAFKLTLCISILVTRVWGSEKPLMTPGDAVSSFVTTPDPETKGMCTLSRQDLKQSKRPHQTGPNAASAGYTWLQGPRPWHKMVNRIAGKAVPRDIWAYSYVLITTSLVVAGGMLALAMRYQSIGASTFDHSPQNSDVTSDELYHFSLVQLTMVANMPQLILSMCYLAHNGLFTRMLGEFEWSRYSVDFHSLRVTEPKGQQRSTYRLQLPYRWSIPLLAISTSMHWVFSNCIYVSNYEDYGPDIPYEPEVTVGLQYSTKAVLIAFVICLFVAAMPLLLAFVKLPGDMVLAGGNSAVISAACHCSDVTSKYTSIVIPESDGQSNWSDDKRVSTAWLMEESEQDLPQAIATRQLKWGQVSYANTYEDGAGHLAFGTREQNVEAPVEGKFYSGL